MIGYFLFFPLNPKLIDPQVIRVCLLQAYLEVLLVNV